MMTLRKSFPILLLTAFLAGCGGAQKVDPLPLADGWTKVADLGKSADQARALMDKGFELGCWLGQTDGEPYVVASEDVPPEGTFRRKVTRVPSARPDVEILLFSDIIMLSEKVQYGPGFAFLFTEGRVVGRKRGWATRVAIRGPVDQKTRENMRIDLLSLSSGLDRCVSKAEA